MGASDARATYSPRGHRPAGAPLVGADATGRPRGPPLRTTLVVEAARLDPEFIRELFAPFGPVTVKRMFGGADIWADGLMFGLVFDGAIFLKVDETSTRNHQSAQATMRTSVSSDSRIHCPRESRFYESGY